MFLFCSRTVRNIKFDSRRKIKDQLEVTSLNSLPRIDLTCIWNELRGGGEGEI